LNPVSGKNLHIACAADERYVPYCAAMLHSLLESQTGMHITIYYLHAPKLPQTTRATLKEFLSSLGAELVLIEIGDDRIANLPTLPRIGPETWFRVLLPELIPDVDRVLYLDADLLVVDDLEPLWTTDLDGYYVGAVSNVPEPWLANRAAELGLPANVTYFNAGVLLLNLAAMRADHCTERLLSYGHSQARNLVMSDQDALNAVLGHKKRTLHPRWNCMNSVYFMEEAKRIFPENQVAEAVSEPAILHFEGPDFAKPWHYLSTHPYRERFWDHLRATPFATPQPSGRTLKNILRKHAPNILWTAFRKFRQQVRLVRDA
jgi:lipopolysaccharide biosynthesis glycosyltransferase